MGIIISLISFSLNTILGLYATISLGFFGGLSIGIINMSLVSASIALGIISAKCLAGIRKNGFQFFLLFIPLVSFVAPAAGILSNSLLIGTKWELAASIFKYVFLAVYLVAGIIPGLIINGFYMLYSLISEDASIAAAIYSMVFAPIIYGIMAGRLLVQKVNQEENDLGNQTNQE